VGPSQVAKSIWHIVFAFCLPDCERQQNERLARPGVEDLSHGDGRGSLWLTSRQAAANIGAQITMPINCETTARYELGV